MTGSLTFNAGTITANTLNVSYNPPASDLSGTVLRLCRGSGEREWHRRSAVNSTLNLAPTLGIAGWRHCRPPPSTSTAARCWQTKSFPAQIAPSAPSTSETEHLFSPTVSRAATPLSALNLTNATVALPVTAAAALNVGAVNLMAPPRPQTKLSVLSLPAIEVYPLTFTVLQSASPISFGGGVFNVKIGSLPPRSRLTPPASQQIRRAPLVLLTVTGGPITVRGNVSGLAPMARNINWSDGANWLLPPVPGALDTAFFNNTGMSFSPGAGSVDNIVDAGLTVAGLTYAETNGFHNTVINAGVTLTVSNPAVDIPLLVRDPNRCRRRGPELQHDQWRW